jgi:acetyl-CoA carboxylase carboxyl transferase subunit alpha
MRQYLDFEKPVAELESKIEELRRMTSPGEINIADEVARLTEKADKQLRALYAKLTPMQKVHVARHPERPKAAAVIAALIEDFLPLAGDRAFADDAAIIGGLGRFRGAPVMVIGTEKGTDTDTRIKHNWGMARPEGYRKARRLMELAGRFGLPILTFVDTSGAYPGIDAEARGQAEAIARGIEACLSAPVPLIATIIGEGGSGGAIALAAGNTVLMFEHAVYSVISPEGCASILWGKKKDAVQAADPTEAAPVKAANGGPTDPAAAALAAEAMRITAQDLKKLGLVDEVIPEPMGGAHRDPDSALIALGDAIALALAPLKELSGEALRVRRREKFLNMGKIGLV